MNNLEIYNTIFIDIFGVNKTALNDNFCKETVEEWDSVHQLQIVAQMEENFDIMLDPEDIMACTSYTAGKSILKKNGVEL